MDRATQTALFLSPHLDDVAFSCGGTVARLAQEGWRTVIATVFTRSVEQPTGFALACQTDKGIPAEIDYMALRRMEDAIAARLLGGGQPVWLPFLEAPHRGYQSRDALFGDLRADDRVDAEVAQVVSALVAGLAPARLFAPQGLGGHVDHLQVVRAVCACGWPNVVWYRDAPYASRHPEAAPAPVVVETRIAAVEIDTTLAIKLDACASYGSQIDYQFGGEAAMRSTLTRFARGEAEAVQRTGYVERMLGPDPLK